MGRRRGKPSHLGLPGKRVLSENPLPSLPESPAEALTDPSGPTLSSSRWWFAVSSKAWVSRSWVPALLTPPEAVDG